MSLTANKIFAGVLIGGISAMLFGMTADHLVHSEELKENAYPIEVAEDTSAGGTEKEVVSITELLTSADAASGLKAAKACFACHTYDKGGDNKTGPNLYGVVGAKAGSHAGFAYSGAFEGKGAWTYEALDAFLKKPKDYAPGTKMTYAGIKNDKKRANVIAWLRTLSDSPMALPKAPTETNE